ncbi:uncharacterized protein LOC109621970 [Aedes albopictus]|uniref:Secreted protein n=1 Tax=Aedes albopictus TaxID=7160 RepID=A0ABM1ZR35_AEDAL
MAAHKVSINTCDNCSNLADTRVTQKAVGSKLGQQNTIERPLQGVFFGRSTPFLTSRQPARHLHRHLCCVACGSRRPPLLATPTTVPWVGATLERSVRALSAEKRESGLELCIREAGETRPVVIRVASAKVAVEAAATATVPTVRVGAGQQLPWQWVPQTGSD